MTCTDPALALSRLKITDDGHFETLPEGVEANGSSALASPVDATPTSSMIGNGMPLPSPEAPAPGREAQRKAKFLRCLREDNVDISALPVYALDIALTRHCTGQLKALAWSGIPAELRPLTWQILLVRPRDLGSAGQL
jgi:hypothetical protein